MGVAGDVVLMLAEIVLAIMLYAMFRSYGSVLALSAAAARLIMVAIMTTMFLLEAGILSLVNLDTQFSALDTDQRAELAWVFRKMHDSGILVG